MTSASSRSFSSRWRSRSRSDEAHAVQGHRHLRGEGVQEAPVRAFDEDGGRLHLEHDAAQAAVLQEEGQRVERRRSGLLARFGYEMRLLARALQDREVPWAGMEGTHGARPTAPALRAARAARRASARTLPRGAREASRSSRSVKLRASSAGSVEAATTATESISSLMLR